MCWWCGRLGRAGGRHRSRHIAARGRARCAARGADGASLPCRAARAEQFEDILELLPHGGRGTRRAARFWPFSIASQPFLETTRAVRALVHTHMHVLQCSFLASVTVFHIGLAAECKAFKL